MPDSSASQVYADMIQSNLDAGNSAIVPGSVNLLVHDLDATSTRFDALVLGGTETGVEMRGHLGESIGVQINGGGGSVLPRVYSVSRGGNITAVGMRVEGAESNPLAATHGVLALVGGTYFSQTRLGSSGQPTIDSLRLAPYSAHPEIDATAFWGDVAVIGAVSNMPILTGPLGRAFMAGQLISNHDNAFAPFLQAGLVVEDPPVDCQQEMPASGTSANAVMLATRVLDSTQKGVDCQDRIPASGSDVLVQTVLGGVQAPQRLVSSCANTAGDVRIHRVYLLMPGSQNGITVSP